MTLLRILIPKIQEAVCILRFRDNFCAFAKPESGCFDKVVIIFVNVNVVPV